MSNSQKGTKEAALAIAETVSRLGWVSDYDFDKIKFAIREIRQFDVEFISRLKSDIAKLEEKIGRQKSQLTELQRKCEDAGRGPDSVFGLCAWVIRGARSVLHSVRAG